MSEPSRVTEEMMVDLLADVQVGELPPGLGGARPVQLAATRYRQGGRTQYHVAVPVAEMTRLIVNRPDPNRPLEGNRKVDANRAKKFGDYLLKSRDWVSPAVIVRVPAHEVDFDAKVTLADGTAWGILSIPLDMLTEIVLLDGQHRTLGVFLALEAINERIARLRQTIARMKEQDADLAAIHEQQERLENDLRIRKRLGDEHLSIDVAEVGPDEAKQMFGDINNNAKGVNPDFTTILDQRDVVNRIAVQVIETHVLLQDRVELGQSARMSPANPNLIGAKGVADICRAVLVGRGRVGARVEDEIAKNMAASVKKVEQYLDVLIGAFDSLRDVMEGREEPRTLREKSMLTSSTILRVLGMVYYELTHGNPDQGERSWSRAEIEDFFRKLGPHFTRIPVAEGDRFWLDTKAFLPGGMAPLASQGAIRALSDSIVGWARLGLPDTQP
jgi:DGQHR domain-containing protein